MFLENSYAMKSITSIEKFKEGDSVQGFFLCLEKHIRHSRNGDLYIDLRLRDKTGSINAKIWDNVNELKKKFKSGDPVAVSGIIELFMFNVFLRCFSLLKIFIDIIFASHLPIYGVWMWWANVPARHLKFLIWFGANT